MKQQNYLPLARIYVGEGDWRSTVPFQPHLIKVTLLSDPTKSTMLGSEKWLGAVQRRNV